MTNKQLILMSIAAELAPMHAAAIERKLAMYPKAETLPPFLLDEVHHRMQEWARSTVAMTLVLCDIAREHGIDLEDKKGIL